MAGGVDLCLAAPRARDLITATEFLDVDVVLACEENPDVRASARDRGIEYRSLEAARGARVAWDNGRLGKLVELLPSGFRGTVLTYAASPAWDEWAQSTGGRVLAPPVALKARVDHKPTTRAELAALGIPVPRSTVVGGGTASPAVPRALGDQLVVQPAVGSSGHGVRVVDRRDTARLVADLDGELLVSEYVAGPVLNVHGVVTAAGPRVVSVSRQLAGLPGASSEPFEFAGNDFSLTADLHRARPALESICNRIGDWLAAMGYRGIFGVDAVAHHGDIRVLEVNPRLQGSTFLLAEMQAAAGCAPILGDHYEALTGTVVGRPEGSGVVTRPAAHMIFRAPQGPFRMPAEVRAGAYTLSRDGALGFAGERYGLRECTTDEVLLWGFPARGTLVSAGAVVARLATWTSIAGRDSGSLNPFGARLRNAVLGQGWWPGRDEALQPQGAAS